MLRPTHVRLVLLAFVLGSTTPASGAPRATRGSNAANAKDLVRARALDREGARAYGEGRYRDAIRAFEEAYRLGGPPFELWNVAKCHLRLDEPEPAVAMLERYLATPGLPRSDRAQATEQLETLRKRPSALTVTSNPAGAIVTIDDKPAETSTPVTTTVSPGPHTVVVAPKDGAPVTRPIEARYGRPLTVDAVDAEGDAGGEPIAVQPAPPSNPYVAVEAKPRVALRIGLGAALSSHGEVGGSGPAFLLSGVYRVTEVGKIGVSVGALVSLAGDAWDNRTGSPDVAPGCTSPIAQTESGTALAVYALGQAAYPVGERITVRGAGGLGLAGYAVDNLGGDLFVPSCHASPGVRPTFLIGTEVDVALTSAFRLAVFPLTWQVQPAFDGAREAPRDASGAWMRFGIGLGAGVDL